MKLAFLNPPGLRYLYRGTICTYISKARYVWKPKDFILLSSTIPPDWPIVFLDAAINRISTEDVFLWIQKESPEAIVMAMSSIAWKHDLSFLIQLRKIFKNKKIIVFGEIFLEASMVEEAKKYADKILFDPLRSNLLEMVTNGTSSTYPHRTGKKEVKMQKTYIPRHTLFDNVKYRWPFVKHFKFASVYTQFGCPFSCSYCTESITNVTYRPANDVLEEMAYLKQNNYKELQIGDASFGYPKENTIKILDGMIEQKFGFVWSSYTYPGLIDSMMLEKMAKSGCHTLVIGIDSADGALLEKYGRNLPQGKIRDFIANCRRNNISVCGDLILGFKEDTKESCLRTIELAIELNLDYASFNIATPMMGSSIRADYKENKLIHQTDTGFDTAGLNEVFQFGTLTAKDLLWLRNYAVQRFYLRPSYILKRLSKSSSLEEIFIKANEAYGIIINLLQQKRSLNDGTL